jgi:predicted TPR repeat methyltransferase
MMTASEEAMIQGIQQQEAGKLIQAEALYRQALDTEPQNLNALYRLAVVCQLQGRVPEAIDHYRQILQIQFDSAQVQNNLALAYASQGQFTEALACCQHAIRLKPDCAEFINNLGTIHNSRGEWDQAANAFRQVLALKPHYAPALGNLGKVYVAQQRLEEAVRCFQEALALQPNNAVIHNDLGGVFFSQGKMAEAGNCYREVARLRPNHAEAWYNLAVVCKTLQQWSEAVACLRKCLVCKPDDPRVPAMLGDIYYYHLANYAEAARCYRQVLALRPDNAIARLLVEVLSGTSQHAQVPAEYVSALYDGLAGQFDRDVHERGDRSPQWLKAALEPPPPPRSLDILDLGCGTGLCGVQFHDWARTLIGVDLSANMLAKARERGVYDELILSDAMAATGARAARFDLVVASDMVLFLGDLGPLFAAVRQALRPGGRFAFTVDLLEGADDYRMTPWVHFAHSRGYLQRVASANRLREVRVNSVLFPRDGGKVATGLVIVLACMV